MDSFREAVANTLQFIGIAMGMLGLFFLVLLAIIAFGPAIGRLFDAQPLLFAAGLIVGGVGLVVAARTISL